MTSSFASKPDPGDDDFLSEGSADWKKEGDFGTSAADKLEISEPDPEASGGESEDDSNDRESGISEITEFLEGIDPSDPSSILGLTPPEGLPPSVAAMLEGVQQAAEEREAYLTELYGEERFDEGDASLSSDMKAYDRTAYTRSEKDLSAYRYNLSDDYYGVQDYSAGPSGGLAADLDSASEPPVGAPPAVNRNPAPGSSGAGYGNAWGSGWSHYGTSGGWGSRSWMSSWYSGYNSSERAIQGVHNHVATFVRNPDYSLLEILPDLDNPEEQTIISQARGARSSSSPLRSSVDNNLTMVARIDSSLYEKLGISEAQQHYIVDCISQVMAAEQLPDPGIIPILHGSGSDPVGSIYALTCLPNVTKEIITEILRARGVSLLLEEMPGWLKRVTAFKGVMYVSEPPDDKIPAAFLMYAVWERDVVDTIEHQDAVQVVQKIEKIIDNLEPFDSAQFNSSNSTITYSAYEMARNGQFTAAIKEIDTLLVQYVTSNTGPIGAIIKELREMQKVLEDSIDVGTVVSAADRGQIASVCSELVGHIHDHNRTFSPNVSRPLDVKHLDFPSCPDKSILPEPVKNRIELTRKCLFNLQRIPKESNGGLDEIVKAKKRVDDMLNEFTKRSGGSSPEEQNEEWVNSKYKGGPGGSRSGVNATRHPELRSKHRLTHMTTDRRFGGEDPDFDRSIVVYDATESVV